MDSSLAGQFALRGSEEVSTRELLNLVEQSVGVESGKTTAQFELPVFPLTRMLEEFFVGMATDTNMAEMVAFFDQNQDAPVTGADFWQATGTSAEENLHQFFKSHRVSQEDESLLLPTFGGYKFNMAD